MLYQITVKVDADSFYHQPYRLEVDNYIIDVILDENKMLEALNIAFRVNNYQNFLPRFTSGIENQPTQIELRDGALLFFLIDLTKHIESLGSFWFRIKKIYWESPKRRWIAETKEEENILNSLTIKDFQKNSEENKCYVEIAPEMLKSLIVNRQLHQSLVLPMSFFREGCNDFSSKRYTNSFINFYFYLDDLYGQCKTKNRDVENLFKSSEHLKNACAEAIELFKEEGSHENLKELNEFLEMERKTLSVDGIIELLVQVRGNLSHFSRKSTKKKGHPLNQRDFRSVAYLIKSICISTFAELTTGEKPR